jgi:transcriptional regulator with XRE-family HTH domain
MNKVEKITSASDAVAMRVRKVRGSRNLSVPKLAARCADFGMPELSAQAIYKIEARRPGKLRPRPVTVDELLTLAAALNVAPVNLLVPPREDAAPYPVTPGVSESRSGVRLWIRGLAPLQDTDDPEDFFSEGPLGEFHLARYGDDAQAAIAALREREQS